MTARMTNPTTPAPGQAEAPTDEDAARAVWLLVAALISRGLPVPHALFVSPRHQMAHLDLDDAEHVHQWARALGAPVPDVHSQLAEGRAERLTSTRTDCDVEGGTQLHLCHLHVEPLDTTTAEAGSGPESAAGVRS